MTDGVEWAAWATAAATIVTAILNAPPVIGEADHAKRFVPTITIVIAPVVDSTGTVVETIEMVVV